MVKKIQLIIATIVAFSLESVVGIPLVTSTLIIQNLAREHTSFKIWWFVLTTLLLGLFYHLSFATSGALIVVSYVGYVITARISTTDRARLFVASIALAGGVGLVTASTTSFTSVVGAILSSLIAISLIWRIVLLPRKRIMLAETNRVIERSQW